MTSPTNAASLTGEDTRASAEVSLLGLINGLMRRWRLLLGLPLAMGVLMYAVSFLMTPWYTATVSFVPEGSGSAMPAALSGLAGQLGLPLGGDGSRSPEFYAQVLMSPIIMDQVLGTQFPSASRGDSVSLMALLDVEGRTRADSLEAGRRALAERVSPRVNSTTSIVELDVETRSRALSAAVANAFISYLDTFNTDTRQSQARAQREFIERRLAETQGELRAAENALQTFYERNRTWRDSPQLAVEEGRLSRQVQAIQGVHANLLTTYETARIQEVNDAPVITVINWATAPSRKSRPQQKLLALLGAGVGGMLALFWALGSMYATRLAHEEPQDVREFREITRSLRAGLRRAGTRPARDA